MSSINPNNIDGTYPIAGQDNDSQGFRDNFTNIKDNFTFAKSEMEDLQAKAILTSALNGGTLNNNLQNAQLKGAQLLKTTETIKDLGTLNGAVSINWEDAHYQIVTTSGAISSMTFTGWPSSGFWTKLRLQIVVTTPSTDTLTLSSSGVTWVNLNNIQGAAGQTITFPTAGSYYFEISTYDGGLTLVIEDVARNYDNVTSDFAVGGNLTVTGALITGFQYSNVVPGTGSGNIHTISSSTSR